MAQAVAVAQESPADIMESVIVKGDLAKLTPQERTQYYVAVCKSVGLNPLTKPMEYITLNGKMVLYALRSCTDQLRSIHGVSVEELTETEREGVCIVTAKVRNKEGRTDIAKGAVTVNGLKGEALANAIMKAETKAKRRATLSICGLGMLDESELDTIPAARQAPAPLPAIAPPPRVDPPHNSDGEVQPHAIPVQSAGWVAWGSSLIAAFKSAPDEETLTAWAFVNNDNLAKCAEAAPKAHKSIIGAYEKRMAEVRPPVSDAQQEHDAVLASGA